MYVAEQDPTQAYTNEAPNPNLHLVQSSDDDSNKEVKFEEHFPEPPLK